MDQTPLGNKSTPCKPGSISKNLLTPCRRVGLSKKKKTPNSSFSHDAGGTPNSSLIDALTNTSIKGESTNNNNTRRKTTRSSGNKIKPAVSRCLTLEQEEVEVSEAIEHEVPVIEEETVKPSRQKSTKNQKPSTKKLQQIDLNDDDSEDEQQAIAKEEIVTVIEKLNTKKQPKKAKPKSKKQPVCSSSSGDDENGDLPPVTIKLKCTLDNYNSPSTRSRRTNNVVDESPVRKIIERKRKSVDAVPETQTVTETKSKRRSRENPPALTEDNSLNKSAAIKENANITVPEEMVLKENVDLPKKKASRFSRILSTKKSSVDEENDLEDVEFDAVITSSAPKNINLLSPVVQLKGFDKINTKRAKLKIIISDDEDDDSSTKPPDVQLNKIDDEEDHFTSTPNEIKIPKENLKEEVAKLEAEVKSKRDELAKLKQAQIYQKLHNLSELKEQYLVWKSGCIAGLEALLPKLQDQDPIDMQTLLKNLQIPTDKIQITAEGKLI